MKLIQKFPVTKLGLVKRMDLKLIPFLLSSHLWLVFIFILCCLNILILN